jgi:hypothetical protein
MSEMRNFAQCMRNHGVPNWPDPTIGPDGGPYFDLSAHGFTREQTNSLQLKSKTDACIHLMLDVGGIPARRP